MSTEVAADQHSSYMTQMRISELELENKTLREKLKVYELKYGTLENSATAPTPKEDVLMADSVDANGLTVMRERIMQEKEAASAKFLELLGNYKKLLNGEAEEQMGSEESFSLPSPLQSQETDVSLDSPVFTPLSTQ